MYLVKDTSGTTALCFTLRGALRTLRLCSHDAVVVKSVSGECVAARRQGIK